MEGADVNPGAVTSGRSVESGLRGGRELVALVEAALLEPSGLPAARDAVGKELGDEALVDAVAVAANFQRMTRIADATGIPLDTPMAMMTAGLRDELGINRYPSARNSKPLNGLQRTLGRWLQPLIPILMKRFTAKEGAIDP